MSNEHLDVLVIGAGLSGISAGHYLQEHCPWATYAIFEGRPALGGTWDLFRYPGIRSDSDMHTLGFSFRPWAGEKTIADGDSILQYVKDTAAEEGIDRKIRFNHRVLAADWSAEDAHWTVTAQRTDTDETFQLTADFVFGCTGYYRYDQGHQPDFPGQAEFEGTMVYPQFWPEDLEVEGKRIVVIGSGATAITLVPSLAKLGAQVTMLQRSPTYIASVPQQSPVVKVLRKVLPRKAAGTALRWTLAIGTQAFYQLSQSRPEVAKRILRKGLERQLPADYDIDTHFTPSYNPWDQRLCAVPNGDLFKAIRSGTAEVVTDHIDTFTPKGILLRSGEELQADIVVSATGLELLFFGGVDVTLDGQEVDLSEKLTYKGMMLEDVPNMALCVGYTNASWTLKAELTCHSVARILNRMHEQRLAVVTPTNVDPSVQPAPLLNLSSGYITRAADRMPKQGNKFPWQVHQSYLRDYRAMRLRGIDDPALVFSHPVAAETKVPATAR